ncbi:MAG: GlsB/YeaQ/YmgE family stress response membrane protein [bacterium]|nr:GlsB/YeaQ/YmgE family stress response membrane protein [bacterium]
MGLISWLVIGLAAGLLANLMLPGEPRMGCVVTVPAGLFGAVAGGLLATVLGFGGLAGYDVRSLATATLAAVLVLLLLRYATLRP